MISTKAVNVTPKLAEEMLERNHLNTRPLNQRRVTQLADVMKAGKWVLTHQGIALDEDGNLIDGQHRLYAIIESQVGSIPLLVTRGLDAAATFAKVDVGKVRSVADALAIAGFTNASLLGAALRMAFTYENSTGRPWGTIRMRITPDDVVTMAATDGERMNHLLPVAARIRGRIGGNTTAYAAALFVVDKWAERHNREPLFASWLEGLDTGVGLEAGDARLALASWVNGGSHLLNNTVRTDAIMIATLRVFGAAVKGETLQKIAMKNPLTWFYRLPE